MDTRSVCLRGGNPAEPILETRDLNELLAESCMPRDVELCRYGTSRDNVPDAAVLLTFSDLFLNSMEMNHQSYSCIQIINHIQNGNFTTDDVTDLKTTSGTVSAKLQNDQGEEGSSRAH